jgi:hypothetical protein
MLVLDEIQLAGSGLVFSSSDHKIVGFADEALNFEAIFDPVATVQDNMAVYVNQYMLKSVDPDCHMAFTCEYFFSGKSISGNEIRAQILHVIRHLDLVGFRVHGVCMDAGGGNAAAVTHLREKAFNETTEDYWLAEEWVSFVHPTDLARRVFLWYCSAHRKFLHRALTLHTYFTNLIPFLHPAGQGCEAALDEKQPRILALPCLGGAQSFT